MKAVGNYGYKLPSSSLTQSIKLGANPEIPIYTTKDLYCVKNQKNLKRFVALQ